MTAATHTPGPFLARRAYFGATGDKFTPYVSAGDTAKVLCFMNLSGAYQGFAGQDIAEADARLFAASAELLAVAQHALYLIEHSMEISPAGLSDLRAAITKATGVPA